MEDKYYLLKYKEQAHEKPSYLLVDKTGNVKHMNMSSIENLIRKLSKENIHWKERISLEITAEVWAAIKKSYKYTPDIYACSADIDKEFIEKLNSFYK